MNQNILNLALSPNNIIIYLHIQINLQKYPHALYQLRKCYCNNFRQWLLIKLFVLGNASVAKFNTLHFVALFRYFLWFQEISQLEAEWYRWSTQGSWDESIVIQLEKWHCELMRPTTNYSLVDCRGANRPPGEYESGGSVLSTNMSPGRLIHVDLFLYKCCYGTLWGRQNLVCNKRIRGRIL